MNLKQFDLKYSLIIILYVCHITSSNDWSYFRQGVSVGDTFVERESLDKRLSLLSALLWRGSSVSGLSPAILASVQKPLSKRTIKKTIIENFKTLNRFKKKSGMMTFLTLYRPLWIQIWDNTKVTEKIYSAVYAAIYSTWYFNIRPNTAEPG